MITLTDEEAIEILKHMSRIEGFLFSVTGAGEIIIQIDYPTKILTEKLTQGEKEEDYMEV